MPRAAPTPQQLWQRQRHKAINPVVKAVVAKRLQDSLARAVTDIQLIAHLGADAHIVLARASRLLFIVLYAADQGQKLHLPEARIVRASEGTLRELHQHPQRLEQLRPSIASALAAAQRLMPHLDLWHLAQGDLLAENQILQNLKNTAAA